MPNTPVFTIYVDPDDRIEQGLEGERSGGRKRKDPDDSVRKERTIDPGICSEAVACRKMGHTYEDIRAIIGLRSETIRDIYNRAAANAVINPDYKDPYHSTYVEPK